MQSHHDYATVRLSMMLKILVYGIWFGIQLKHTTSLILVCYIMYRKLQAKLSNTYPQLKNIVLVKASKQKCSILNSLKCGWIV